MSNDKGQISTALALVGQLGFIMITCILMGLGGGLYLDSILGTRPALSIVLLLLGVASGMLACYRMIMKSISDEKKDGSNDE